MEDRVHPDIFQSIIALMSRGGSGIYSRLPGRRRWGNLEMLEQRQFLSNTPPISFEDRFTIAQGEVLEISQPEQGVLANDYDTDGDELFVADYGIFDKPEGIWELSRDGLLMFAPAEGFIGEASLNYTVSDGDVGGTCDATVYVVVLDQIPLGQWDYYEAVTGQPLDVVPEEGVLSNDISVGDGPLTAELIAPPAIGNLSLCTDGSFTYCSTADFAGNASFTYRVIQGAHASELVTVTIVVRNTSPVAIDDFISGAAGNDTDISIGTLLANDYDPDSAAFFLVDFTQPLHGTLSRLGDLLTYHTQQGFCGVDSFTYWVSDAQAQSLPATVTITVSAPDLQAADDSFAIDEDSAAALDVLWNDTYGGVISVAVESGANFGTVTFNEQGQLIYTPDADFFGEDSFSYAVSDGFGGRSVAWVSIEVLPVNDRAQVPSQTYSVSAGGTISGNLLLNATDADLDRLVIDTIGGWPPGIASLLYDSLGNFTLTALPTATGQGTLDVQAVEKSQQGDIGISFQVTIQFVNFPPVPQADSYFVRAGGELDIVASSGLLANDSDEFLSTLTALPLEGPSQGLFELYPDGSFVFTPAPGQVGTYSFSYLLYDGANAPVVGQGQIAVVDVGSAQAFYDRYACHAGKELTVPANRGLLTNDVGSSLMAELVDDVPVGALSLAPDGSFTYLLTPEEYASCGESVSFTYRLLLDNVPTDAVATVYLDISNFRPVACDDYYTYAHGTDHLADGVLGVLANDYDHDGDPLRATLLDESGEPAPMGPDGWRQRSVGDDGYIRMRDDGAFTFHAPSRQTGEWSIAYVASDGRNAIGLVHMKVADARPVCLSRSYRLHHSGALVIDPRTCSYDGDGDELRIFWHSQIDPSKGSLISLSDGTLEFRPAANASNETVSFGIILTDDVTDANGQLILSEAVFFTIDVWNTLATPIADTFCIHHTQTLSGNVLANDGPELDGDGVSAYLYTPAGLLSSHRGQHGLFNLTPEGELTYEPDWPGVQADSIRYLLTDGVELSTPVTINLYIEDNAPSAYDDHYQGTVTQKIEGDVERNDFDYDVRVGRGETLEFEVVTGPKFAKSFSFNNGAFEYEADPDRLAAAHAASDSFTYRIYDGAAFSRTATARITFTPGSAAARNDEFITSTGKAFPPDETTEHNILANDVVPGSSAENPPRLIINGQYVEESVSFQTANGGSVTLTAGGDVTYVSAPSFVGTDSFTYTLVSRDDGSCSSATAEFTVLTGVLTAADDGYSVPAGQALTVDVSGGVRANDVISGIGQDAASPNGAVDPVGGSDRGGTISMNPDGSFVYTPPADFCGSDSFTYTIRAGGLAASARVSIVVYSASPAAGDDLLTGTENQPLIVPVSQLLANDVAGSPAAALRPGDLQIVSGPHGGQASIVQFNGQTCLQVTPTSGFWGSDALTYKLVDRFGNASDCAAVNMTFAPVAMPHAANDSATTIEDQAVAIDVLANDLDPDHPGMIPPGRSITQVQQPGSGTAVLQTDGTILYTPRADFAGSDLFYYRMTCGSSSFMAAVTVTVCAANDMPSAPNITVTATAGVPLLIAPNTLIVDPDDTTPKLIEITQSPQSGWAWAFASSLVYLPPAAATGTQTIGYRVYDHQWQASGEGTITVNIDQGGPGPEDPPQPPEGPTIEIDLPDNQTYTCESYGLEIYSCGGLHAVIESGSIVLSGGAFDEPALCAISGDSQNWNVVWAGNTVQSLTIDCGGAFAGAVAATGMVYVSCGGNVNADVSTPGNICVLGGAGATDVEVDATGFDVSVGVSNSSPDTTGRVRGHINAQNNIYILMPNSGGPVGTWSLEADLHAAVNISGLTMFKGQISATVDADMVFTSGVMPDDDNGIRAYGDVSGNFNVRTYSFVVESLFGSVNAGVTGRHVEKVSAGRDVSGSIDSNQVLSSEVTEIIAGRDIGATVHVTGFCLATAGRDISGLIDAGTIGTVTAGRDVLSNLTSLGAIEGVRAYRTLCSQMLAQGGGIGPVSAGEQNSNPQLSSPGLIVDSTIHAYGDIVSIGCSAPEGTYGGSAGALTNVTIISDTGRVNSITASGTFSGSVTSAEGIGEVIVSGDISAAMETAGGIDRVCSTMGSLLGNINAYGDIGGIDRPIEAKGDIAGSIQSESGSVGGILAGGSVLGAVSAGSGIGGVSAGGRIAGNLQAGTSIGDIIAGGEISSQTISAGGSIGEIGSGSYINSAIEAGGSIGNIWAGFGRRPDGLTPTSTGWIDSGAMIHDGLAPDIDDPEIYRFASGPVAPTLGRVDAAQAAGCGRLSGSLLAGGPIGSITITGALDGAITSAAGIGAVWVLGDIAGVESLAALDAGAGQLQVNCWGSFEAGVQAGGADIKSLGSIHGQVNTGSQAKLTSWSPAADAITALVTAGQIDIWSLGGVSIPRSVSQDETVINAWSDVNLADAKAAALAVTATGSLTAAVDAPRLGTVTLKGQNLTINTPEAEAKFGAGYFLAYCGGNLVLSPGVSAPKGAMIWARGSVTGTINSGDGEVMIAALGDANVSVTSGSRVCIEANKISGDVTAKAASLKAAGDVAAKIVVSGDVALEVRGNLAGSIAADGDVSASVTGNVTCNSAGAGISATGAIGITSWGEINTWAKADDNIIARALGDIRESKFEAQQIELVTWGALNATVSAAVDAIIFSAGTIEGTIAAAGGCASVESWASISAPVSAGDEATVTAFGTIQPSATVTAGQNVTISAHHDVQSEITSTAGAADVSAGDAVSGKIKAAGNISVIARTVGNAEGNLIFESTGGSVSVMTLEDCLLGSAGAMPAADSRGILASTGASVYAGGSAKLAVKTSGLAASVNITALGRGSADGECLLALVEAPEAAVDILSGANACVLITATEAVAPPNNVSLSAAGSVHDSVLTARTGVTVSGASESVASAVSADVRTTVPGGGQITVSADGDVDGTYRTEGGLTVSASGSASGVFSAGLLGATVCAMGSVFGSISSGGDAVVVASGDSDGAGTIAADVLAQGSATVCASGNITEQVDAAAGSASVSSTSGSILGAVSAAADIAAFAGGDITGRLDAGGSVSAAALACITTNANSINGEMNLSALQSVSGQFEAQGPVDISAGSFDGAVISHTGSVNITSGGGLSSSSIEAFSGVSLSAAGSIFASASGLTVNATSLGSVSGNYTSRVGDVSISAGDSIEASVSSACSAFVAALNNIAGSVAARFGIQAIAFGCISATLTAGEVWTEDPAEISVIAGGDVSGQIRSTFGLVTIDAGDDVSANVSAAGDVHISLQGELTAVGSISSDAGVVVSAGGAVAGNISAGANATISSLAAVSSQSISAAGSLNVTATQGILHSLLSAGADLTVSAGNTMSISSFDATSGGSTELLILGDLVLSNIFAGGDLTISSTGAVGSNLDQIEALGNIDITSGGPIGADITSAGFTTLFCLGSGISGELDSFGDLKVVCKGGVSSPYITSAGSVDVVAVGDVVGGMISGSTLVRVATAGQMNDDIWSSGPLSISAARSFGTWLVPTFDARVMIQGDFSGTLDFFGRISFMYIGGDFSGSVNSAGPIVRMIVGGNISSGAAVASASDIESILVLGRASQCGINAAGNLNEMIVCGDVAQADISASIIDGVLSYGSIDATINAGSYVYSIEAAGNISGRILSPYELPSVHAGGSVTAEVVAGSHVVENDPYAAAGPLPLPLWAGPNGQPWSPSRAAANFNDSVRLVLQAAEQAQQTMQSLSRASAAYAALASASGQQARDQIAQHQLYAGGMIVAAARYVSSATAAATTELYRRLDKESAAQAQRAGAAEAQIAQSRSEARSALRQETAEIDKALADLNAQQKLAERQARESETARRAQFAAEIEKIQHEAAPEVRERNWQEQVNTIKPQVSAMIDKLVGDEALDKVQMVLSYGSVIVSFVPGVGLAASAAMSAANGCISLARGNYAEAATDLLLPAVGAAGKVAGKLSRMYASSERALVRALKFVDCKILSHGCFVSGTLVAVPAVDGATGALASAEAVQAGVIDEQGQSRRGWMYASAALGVVGLVGGRMIVSRRRKGRGRNRLSLAGAGAGDDTYFNYARVSMDHPSVTDTPMLPVFEK